MTLAPEMTAMVGFLWEGAKMNSDNSAPDSVVIEGQRQDDSYRREIERALEIDQSRLGDVFRGLEGNIDQPDYHSIAEQLGLTTAGTVYSAVGSIKTLLECNRLTNGPTLAGQRASMLRSFMGRHSELLTDESRSRLSQLEKEHDRVARDEEAIARENQEIERNAESELEVGVPGIYVYTFPHYIKYPVVPTDEDDTNPRTYLKIGQSTKDMVKRVRDQIAQNKTVLPEPPVILRMYKCPEEKTQEIERKIHRHLSAADHSQNRNNDSGREWFLTHLQFVDSTADLLGLELVYEHRDD